MLSRGLAAIALSAVALSAMVSPAGATELKLLCDGTISATEFGIPVQGFAFGTPVTLPSGLIAVFTRVDEDTVHADYTNPANGDTWTSETPIEAATGCDTVPPTTPPPAPPTTPPPVPGFAFAITAVCRNDTPILTISAQVDGATAGTPMVLHWLDASGVERLTQTVTVGTTEVLWPGAAVDASGEPTDWPGWVQVGPDEWVEAADGFEWARPNISMFATVNPTSATLPVSYPPSNPLCRTQPPGSSSRQEGSTLPETGDGTKPIVISGSLLLAMGALFVVVTRHRLRAGEHQSR
jgi:LPXTG-motif cell wall-anchored protein